MLKPNLLLIRRRLLFKALSWMLRILDKPGLMKQPLETELLIAAARRRARLDNFGVVSAFLCVGRFSFS
jgi:hypothetical protein